MAAVFVSMLIHGLLAYLLCVATADRTGTVGPAAPSTDAPLIVSMVSLSELTAASRDRLASKAPPAVPEAAPPAQTAPSPPERSPSIERTSEAEPVVTSKDQAIPEPEALAAASAPSTGAASSHAATREVVRIPEFEAGMVLPRKGLEVMGPETSSGKYPASGTSPSFHLEAAYSIGWEAGRNSLTEFELQDLRFGSRALYLKNHLGITKEACQDCRTAYAGAGLFAIPLLLKDTITNSGCTWEKLELRDRQVDYGREKDQERQGFMSQIMNRSIFGPEP